MQYGLGLGLSVWNSNYLYPSMSLNFLSGSLDPRMTFTRASTATYFDSAGAMQTASADAPRFDYDPATLAPKGLLIEGSRTNLLLRSQEFDNAAWTKNGATVSANSISAPDGSSSGDKIVETETTAVHQALQSASVTFGVVYTASFFVRASERSFALAILTDSGFADHAVSINLSTGSVSAAQGSPTGLSSENAGNGWWRVRFSAAAAATASGRLTIYTSTDGVWTNRSYLGNTSSGIYVWGAQLEAGAFASSYIPTTTAAVTRAADSAVMTGANFSSWFNQSEGTIAAEFSTITTGLNASGGNDFPFVWDIDSSGATTSGHSLIASAAYGPGIRAQTQNAGVSAAELTSAVALGTGAIMRHAYAYKANDFAASLNGGTVLSGSSGTLPTPARMSLGSQDGGVTSQLFGHISRLQYYRTRLSNSELQRLTT